MPVRVAVELVGISKVGDGVLLLADLERVCSTSWSKGTVIDTKLCLS